MVDCVLSLFIRKSVFQNYIYFTFSNEPICIGSINSFYADVL